jgi:DNA-binding NarL/FixJ family response regulator
MGGLLKDKLDKEIADETGTSFKTVRTHVGNIFQKFGVHGRAAACAAYLTRNL